MPPATSVSAFQLTIMADAAPAGTARAAFVSNFRRELADYLVVSEPRVIVTYVSTVVGASSVGAGSGASSVVVGAGSLLVRVKMIDTEASAATVEPTARDCEARIAAELASSHRCSIGTFTAMALVSLSPPAPPSPLSPPAPPAPPFSPPPNATSIDVAGSPAAQTSDVKSSQAAQTSDVVILGLPLVPFVGAAAGLALLLAMAGAGLCLWRQRRKRKTHIADPHREPLTPVRGRRDSPPERPPVPDEPATESATTRPRAPTRLMSSEPVGIRDAVLAANAAIAASIALHSRHQGQEQQGRGQPGQEPICRVGSSSAVLATDIESGPPPSIPPTRSAEASEIGIPTAGRERAGSVYISKIGWMSSTAAKKLGKKGVKGRQAEAQAHAEGVFTNIMHAGSLTSTQV